MPPKGEWRLVRRPKLHSCRSANGAEARDVQAKAAMGSSRETNESFIESVAAFLFQRLCLTNSERFRGVRPSPDLIQRIRSLLDKTGKFFVVSTSMKGNLK